VSQTRLKQVAIYLSDDEFKILDEEAKALGSSVSKVSRDAICNYLGLPFPDHARGASAKKTARPCRCGQPSFATRNTVGAHHDGRCPKYRPAQ
jgi:hypothetical protein